MNALLLHAIEGYGTANTQIKCFLLYHTRNMSASGSLAGLMWKVELKEELRVRPPNSLTLTPLTAVIVLL